MVAGSIGRESVSRTFVAARGSPVQLDDAFLRGRRLPAFEPGDLVFELLAEVRDLAEGRVGIGQRLPEGFPGLVEGLELSPVHGRARLGEGRGRPRQDQSANDSLHESLL